MSNIQERLADLNLKALCGELTKTQEAALAIVIEEINPAFLGTAGRMLTLLRFTQPSDEIAERILRVIDED